MCQGEIGGEFGGQANYTLHQRNQHLNNHLKEKQQAKNIILLSTHTIGCGPLML